MTRLVLPPLLLALLAPARAASVRETLACLARSDLACAQREAAGLAARATDDPAALRALVLVAFHEGDYEAAARWLERFEAAGGDAAVLEERYPVRATLEAARGLVPFEGDGVVVRTAAGVETVLAPEAIATLEACRRRIDPLLGGGPPYRVLADIFPSARRFIAASGLPPDAVRTTGVVALSKWTRLLVTTPRATVGGYPWRDTVAHEYIHLVIAWRTGDLAPVWLHEGIAKLLEQRWRAGGRTDLAPRQQAVLAEALARDSFVPFEKFRSSMAYLDSGQEAALAFAEVASMVRFFLDRAGEPALAVLLDRVRDGEEAASAFADLAGFDDFDAFERAWRADLARRPLVREHLDALPVVLDGEGGIYDADPLLGERPDLARRARVGDLLLRAGHPRAALVEFRRAREGLDDDRVSPLLLAREARCHLELGDLARALERAEAGLAAYPEFLPLHVVRGRVLDELGRPADAVDSWLSAEALDPFDPEVREALVRDLDALGRTDEADPHRRALAVLRSGGLEVAEGGG